ncbi:T9SS type A sorting domain-containing protein [Flammeovirga agarivorans]|uniref:T9SS type A sorting domain-containing protein n=1 Tax=Flammeovirga agarivorans TaxID=2726742 RepID=A0A7X8SNB7_9BACT|nr:T9SS type A sorting domain-containing protein [Flammeovirga agarivorans]NLR93325.1 T9SS type A sorting domain-containing protein [Flammeovirga agarivorans]
MNEFYFLNRHSKGCLYLLVLLFFIYNTTFAQSINDQNLPINLQTVTSDVVFETGRFSLTINSIGVVSSLKKKNGKEVLKAYDGFNLVFSEGNTKSLNKFYTSGDKYIFATSDRKYYATFEIKETSTYLAFDLVDFYGDLPQGTYLKFTLSADEHTKGMCFDYTNIDTYKDTRYETRFEHLRDRYKDNSLGGFILYTFDNESEEDESIIRAWGEEAIPHPTISGTWNYDAARQWIEDWKKMFEDQSVMYISPENVEELTQFEPYLEMADVTTVNFFTDMWHGGFWPYDKLNWEVDGIFGSQTALKSYSQQQQQKGRSINIHYVSGGIGKGDPLYGKENLSDELATWVEGTLQQNITQEESSILFKPNRNDIAAPESIYNASNHFGHLSIPLMSFFKYHYLKIGKELIEVDAITTHDDGTWEFTVKNRAINSTVSSEHSQGEKVEGIMLAYNQVYVPNNNSELFKTLTTKYAELLNDCSISNASFDGAEIHAYDGQWGFRKYAQQVYEKLDHPVVVRTSNGKEPDAGYLEYKINETKKYLQAPVGDHNQGRPSLKLERNSTTNKGVYTAATNILAAHFMLGIQAASGGRNYSILRPDPMFGITIDELETYGKTEELLELLPKWKDVGSRLTDEQKQRILDTHYNYLGNLKASTTTFELRETADNYHLVPIQMMSLDPNTILDDIISNPVLQRFHMKQEDGMYVPKVNMAFGDTKELDNQYHQQQPQFILRILRGEEQIVNPYFEIGDSQLMVETTLSAVTDHTQYIEYRGGDHAIIYDQNWNKIKEAEVKIEGDFYAKNGYNEVTLGSENSSTAAVELLLFTEGEAISLVKQNNDAQLKDILVDKISIEGFSSDQIEYDIELQKGTTMVPEVSVLLSDNNASATISQAIGLPGTTEIIVYAENGVDKLEYTVNFTVDMGSGNANLSELYFDGLIYKEFDPNIEEYKIILEENRFPNIDVFLEDQTSTYEIIGENKFGETIKIVVTAQDGTNKTYSLVLYWQGALSASNWKDEVYVYKSNPRTLTIKSSTNLQGKEVIIYDIHGKLIEQQTLSGNLTELTILSKGIYLVQIVDNQFRNTYKVLF